MSTFAISSSSTRWHVSYNHLLVTSFKLLMFAYSYSPEYIVSFTEKKSIMTKTDIALTALYNNLPSVLRLPPTSSRPLPPHMYCFQYVPWPMLEFVKTCWLSFSMHFYTLVILLHRPFIAIPSDNGPSRRSINESATTSLETCIKAAEKVTVLFRAYAKFFTLVKTTPLIVYTHLPCLVLIHLTNRERYRYP